MCIDLMFPILLLQLIDWVDPAPVILSNDSVFVSGPRDSNGLIHSSEEGIAFHFSLGFKSFPICIGHYNIYIPIKSKYVLQDSRI